MCCQPQAHNATMLSFYRAFSVNIAGGWFQPKASPCQIGLPLGQKYTHGSNIVFQSRSAKKIRARLGFQWACWANRLSTRHGWRTATIWNTHRFPWFLPRSQFPSETKSYTLSWIRLSPGNTWKSIYVLAGVGAPPMDRMVFSFGSMEIFQLLHTGPSSATLRRRQGHGFAKSQASHPKLDSNP